MKIAATVLAAALAVIGLAPTASAEPERPERLHVVTAGDSITFGAGAAKHWSYPDQLERTHRRDVKVTNVGRSASCLVAEGCGDPVTLVSTFRRDVLRLRPDVAIVSIGRNDLCHTATADYKAALLDLRGQGEAVGVRVIFGTITPPNERWQWPCEEQAADINEWLLRMPSTIDFAAALDTRAGELRKKYDSGDGLHPNGAGYKVMSRVAEVALLR